MIGKIAVDAPHYHQRLEQFRYTTSLEEKRMPAHKDGTLHFHELTPGEQAKSINAQVMNLEAAIKYRVTNASDKQKMRDGLETQIKNLLGRVSQIPV